MFNEKGMETIEEFQKSQWVRVIDILFIGPFLIYVSSYKRLPKFVRVVLFIIGVATIVYNGNNYIKNLNQ